MPLGPITGGGPTKAYVDAGDAASVATSEAYTDAALAALVIPPAGPVFLYELLTPIGNGSTDGTEDDLFSITIPAGFMAENERLVQREIISSAVAVSGSNLQFRKYLNGTLIYDSGNIDIAALAQRYFLETTIIFLSHDATRCIVRAEFSDQALFDYTHLVKVPAVDYTSSISGDFSSSDFILKTTANSGVTSPFPISGNSNDIIDEWSTIIKEPLAQTII